MRFAQADRKLMTQGWTENSKTLAIENHRVELMSNSIYLGSCLTRNGTIEREIFPRAAKVGLTFRNLSNMWSYDDITSATILYIKRLYMRSSTTRI